MDLQQISQQNFNNVERQSSNTNSLFSSRTDAIESDKKSSFKDRLNDEIKQVKVADKNENFDKKQKDSDSEIKYKKIDNKSKDRQNNEIKTVEKSNKDELQNKPVKNKVTDEDKAEITGDTVVIEGVDDDRPGETLPSVTGSELPFFNPEINLTDPGAILSTENTPRQIAAPSNLIAQTDIELEAVGKLQVDSSIQKQISMNEDVPLILAGNREFKPLNVSVTTSEKIQMQDTAFNKLMSEVPAEEMITQAAKLQQVPSVSAMASNPSAAQSTTLNPLLETNITNSTPQLGKVLSSAISTNIQNPNWSQQLTQQVSYMVKGGLQQAEIKLNPANLGPMEIKLSLQDDQASVQFITQHVVVRDALDAAIPKLKDMLEQQGLNLSDVDVSTQSEQQGREDSQSHSEVKMDSVSNKTDEAGVLNETLITTRVNSGLSIFA